MMSDDELAAAKDAMKRWYWWGIPTFFRCDWKEDPAASDIAIIGVPHSSGNGSTERDQHLAPRAVRHVSATYRREALPWNLCRINDAGDVPLPEAMVNDVSVRHIESFVKRFDAAGTRVVSMGGDHSITGPILKAFGGPNATVAGDRPLALVHFDAHLDSYHDLPHWLGNRRSAAHWASYAVTEGHVDARLSTQVGVRSTEIIPGVQSTSDELGYRVVGMDEFETTGVIGVVDIIRQRCGDAPVYITFDLDALDPCDAPAAANLEPGYTGLRIGETIRILRGLRGLNIVGADVVCMIPTKDNPNLITAMNSMVLMYEMICLIAHYLSGHKLQRP